MEQQGFKQCGPLLSQFGVSGVTSLLVRVRVRVGVRINLKLNLN
jgi:hypothetical protein